MSDKRISLLDWLGLPSEADFSKARIWGRILGWGATGLYGLLVLTLLFGLITVMLATIGQFFEARAEVSWDTYRWSLLTIATLTATSGAALALPFTILRTRYTQRQTVAAEQNLITDRINQAVAGLGAEKVVKVLTQGSDGMSRVVDRSEPNIEVRVGAILSLERISENSAEDHVRIMEILCAYVRENACIVSTKAKPEGPEDWKQRTDTQMALTVIGRRTADRLALETTAAYTLDLRGADVQLADMSQWAWQNADLSHAVMARALLWGANLQMANLWGANLQEAHLGGANMQEANLVGAKLQEAHLDGANLQEAYLGDANLQEANLVGANLQEANLKNANMQEANLGGANLQEAKLWDTNLQEAYLGDANLQEADLRGANLQEANLWDANLQKADLRDASLQEANLAGANLQKASFGDAPLKPADLGVWPLARTFLISADFTESQNLSQEAVNSAFGVASGIGHTILPEGLTAPAHWHVAADVDEDSLAHQQAAGEAYQDWLATLPPETD